MAGNRLSVDRIVRAAPDPSSADPDRQAALAALRKSGFPSSRHEDWRHNRRLPFGGVDLTRPPKPAPPDTAKTPFTAFPQLSILDGYSFPGKIFQPWLASRKDFQFLPGQNPFFDLNMVLSPDPVFLAFPPDTLETTPFYFPIRDTGNAGLTHPRLHLTVRSGSNVTVLIQQFSGNGNATARNLALTVHLEPMAHLTLFTLDETMPGDTRMVSAFLTQDRDSTLNWTHLSLAKGQSRLDIQAILEDEGGELNIQALGLVSDSAEADIHSVITHAAPNTTSREAVKNVLSHNAHGIFNGKVVVRPHAVQTDSRQSNRNLLLSSTARMYSNPQLEIYADDVRCSHGSATGQLDPDQLFYLQTRGLDTLQSTALLIQGFAREILDHFTEPAILDYGLARLAAWLNPEGRPHD
ncbi:MAG: Fe-S cluster assembly protein SufD [FCB group bacterium]|nr:Fe-S cluster assembly protein SufD [FCB group bacterium]